MAEKILDQELESAYREWLEDYSPNIWSFVGADVQAAFLAGAKWQARRAAPAGFKEGAQDA